MAEIGVVPSPEGNTRLYLWETLKGDTTDTGERVEGGDFPDITVQVVSGNYGVGGSVNLEGSNDGSTWAILTDPEGNALTFTANGLKQVSEACKYYRPNVTAGDSDTDIDVYLYMRRSR